MKNIKEAIKELNAPEEIEGEMFESPFNFKIREYEDHIEIYDSNENYHSDYAYESYYMACSIADEFGFKPPKEMTDDVYDALNEAVKKDFGKDAYIDWYDHVTMMAYR